MLNEYPSALVSAFVAKISASLTVGELTSQIRGYRDLSDRRIGTTAGSTAAQAPVCKLPSAIAFGCLERAQAHPVA